MKVSILGYGWLGLPLAIHLKSHGVQVVGSTTSESKKAELEAQDLETELLKYPQLPSQKLLNADIVVLNIPPFAGELEWFKTFSFNPKTWIILISSTSGNLVDQENWMRDSFKHWTIIRMGGLLGGGRHPAKYLSGKKNLSSPLTPVNLIHQIDAVGLVAAVIEKNIQGELIYGVSDEHSSRKEFYQDACRRLGLPLPEFDEEERTIKEAVSGARAKEIYDFKFPTMLGKDL